MKKIYIIAEAGVNHNGNKEIAFKLIDKGVAAGADAIKFQIFKAENLATASAEKAPYQLKTTKTKQTQKQMLKSLELSLETYFELKKYCEKLNTDFLITAFDHESLEFIIKKLKVKKLKIPSGEITNGPFILQHARSGLDIILSTGMADIAEIEKALSIIAYGYLNIDKKDVINADDFEKAYKSTDGQKKLRSKVTLLHCTTEYPAPLDELNLNAIKSLNTKFQLQTGYSDHSNGIIASIIASTLDISVIEKHFTLDKNMNGPDHKASLDPQELELMIDYIRSIENIMGNGKKRISKSETKNLHVARKSIVAIRDIKKGEIFTENNISFKRPGLGISPMKYWDIINKVSDREYKKDELIK